MINPKKHFYYISNLKKTLNTSFICTYIIVPLTGVRV